MPTLTINGREITVQPNTTVLDAALAHDIDIPRLCHHPELKPSGGCRLCMVEIDGRPNPQPSCGLIAQDGMNIHTETEQLHALRHDIIDLFVSDHPLVCASCDKNGHCDLQKYAYQYDITETSYDFELSRTLYQDDNPFFIRDHQMCILCAKCVRVCDEVVGANAIDLIGRGFNSQVATPFNGPMIDSSCVFCGSCVQVCPTAALLPKSRVRQGREWELQRQKSICGYCGVGCGVEYALKDGHEGAPPHIVYAQGYVGAPANGEFLCVKGRYGWDFATSPDRLTEPLIRKDLAHELGLSDEAWTLPKQSVLKGKGNSLKNYVAVDWERAMSIVTDKLAAIYSEYGADALAGLASARCTNEDNYLFQKLFRATLGTNNVDHCARLCHASTVAGLAQSFGSGAMTNSIAEIRHADCIFVTGSNTSESHPVISYEVVRAVKSGASLIVVDPRRIPLVDHATLFLPAKPGTDGHIFMAMMHVILREGWADEEFIRTRTEGFEAFAGSVEMHTPETAALISGVPAELIEQAARLYALGERQSGTSHYGAAERGRSTILYAMGITQRRNGTDLVMTLANLSMLCGQIGKPSTGVNPLRGQSNVQGACDVGCLPNVLPGYQAVVDESKRQAVGKVWGVESLPPKPGLTIVEIMRAAEQKQIRGMYVMGENPMLSDPNIGHVETAIRALDFLVVQDIFLSETAELAHVILPATASLEKEGTFTNTERRVQLFAPVLPAPGLARDDWRVVAELGQRLAAKLGQTTVRWQYGSTAEIMSELAASAPIYGGMSYGRLPGKGLTWPCPTAEHPGTPILHTTQFSRGLGMFKAIKAQVQAEEPDAEYPLILTTGRILYHYHTGTMTRRSEPLNWRESRGYVEVNEVDAANANIRDGGWMVVHSRRGEVRAQARITDRVAPGTIFLSFHWKEAPANLLTQDHTLDPVAKIPEFKVCAVRIEGSGRGR
ncbi:MAG: formate dehydrogenase subunit alpha [Chloroflexi bacterium]|nr:formate dehydrogenase subunit alpha [Chloroflexota bacterium]